MVVYFSILGGVLFASGIKASRASSKWRNDSVSSPELNCNTGDLFVELIDGHQLKLNQEYLIADVFGELSGEYTGLGEGDLVGNFGGKDLFISYLAGSGNDVALYTAVPEPGSMAFCAFALLFSFVSGRWIRSVTG